MSKKLDSIAITLNIILLFICIEIIFIFSFAFHNAISYLIYHVPINAFAAKLSSYSVAMYLLFSLLVIIVLIKEYNCFNLWLKRQHKSFFDKFSDISKSNELNDNFIENYRNTSDSMQMLVFPWGIVCIFNPLFLQIPLYILLQNWRKISFSENNFLQKTVNVIGSGNVKLKPIIFSTKDIWFWIIVFNISLGMLAPIWIFFYLRKVRHFVEDIRISLNLINKLLNN